MTTAPSTTRARILAIAAFTLLPLLGVLLFGWDWREVLALYWFENVLLGIAMVIRLLRTAGDSGDELMRKNGLLLNGPIAGILLTIFFTFHYGMFTLVHGVFVFGIIGGAFGPASAATTQGGIDWVGILIVWAIGGIVQVLIAAIGPLPAQRGNALMMSAYPRIIALHIAIIGGAFLIALLGLPAIAAILLIGLHGAIDVIGWLRAARRERHVTFGASARSDPATADPAEPRPPQP